MQLKQKPERFFHLRPKCVKLKCTSNQILLQGRSAHHGPVKALQFENDHANMPLSQGPCRYMDAIPGTAHNIKLKQTKNNATNTTCE